MAALSRNFAILKTICVLIYFHDSFVSVRIGGVPRKPNSFVGKFIRSNIVLGQIDFCGSRQLM